MKHMKGRWLIRQPGEHHPKEITIVDEGSMSMHGVVHSGIARVCIRRSLAEMRENKPSEQEQANARLIASAPALLEACQAALQALPEKCSCHESYTTREKALGYRFKDPDCLYCEFEDEIKMLCAAIASATEGQ